MKSKNFCNIKFKTVSIYILYFVLLFLPCCSRQPVYPEPPMIGSEVVIDVSNLDSKKPQFFSYHYRNKIINFFVIKIDNKVLSFIDACTECYPQKLGYRFDDGYIICKACNVRYSVSEVEKGFGSCYPIQIMGHLQDGKYLIPVSALKRMAFRF